MFVPDDILAKRFRNYLLQLLKDKRSLAKLYRAVRKNPESSEDARHAFMGYYTEAHNAYELAREVFYGLND